MSEAVRIRRILVALDVSPDSLAAAEVAAELAVLLRAELVGIYVEDAELLHLSASPLAREVDLLTTSLRALEAPNVEQQLRVQAGRARRQLERIAGRAGIPWSFRVARGVVAAEILSAAAEVDLVSVGRIGWTFRPRPHLGRTARALLCERRGLTLLLGRRVPIRPPIVVLYDGSEAAERALAAARELAGLAAGPLRVLLVGGDGDRLRGEVEGRLGEAAPAEPVPVEIEALGAVDEAALPRVLRHRTGGGVLVVPLGTPPLMAEQLQRLLDELRCAVLAVS